MPRKFKCHFLNTLYFLFSFLRTDWIVRQNVTKVFVWNWSDIYITIQWKIMSNFLQLLSPLLRKFRTSTRSSLSKQQNSQTSSSSENNEDENENEEATKTTPEEKEKSRRSETDPPTNEKQPQLSKATKGIYDLRIDKQTWITFKDTNLLDIYIFVDEK